MSFKPLFPSETKLVELPEGASQTFVAGNLVYLSGGYVVEDTGGDPADTYGVAAQNAHNDASAGTSNVLIYPIEPNSWFVARVATTTGATNVGEDYGIVLSSSTWYVDLADTTNTRVHVEKLDPRDPAGTANGRVYVTFKSTAIQRNS